MKPKTLMLVHDCPIRREISGTLAEKLNIDFTLPLPELRVEIERALKEWQDQGKKFTLLQRLKLYFSEGLLVYEGGRHIDVVADGEGSLNILIVKDYLV